MNNFDRLDKEMWNLDGTFAEYVWPRLLYWKIFLAPNLPVPVEYTNQTNYYLGVDWSQEEMDDWDYDLREMVNAFKMISEESWSVDKNVEARTERALSIFRQQFRGLWT